MVDGGRRWSVGGSQGWYLVGLLSGRLFQYTIDGVKTTVVTTVQFAVLEFLFGDKGVGWRRRRIGWGWRSGWWVVCFGLHVVGVLTWCGVVWWVGGGLHVVRDGHLLR